MAKSKSKRLTSGRPPLSKPPPPTLSSKATRTLIRTHHTLLKAHASALSTNNAQKAASIAAEITSTGGLASYQLASTQGQSSTRGGDSSRILTSWLQPAFTTTQSNGARLRMLEVGALSMNNACSRIPCLDIDRIDLHSQAPGIREIDFMALPLPETEATKYHLLSLSLVLNFVPEAGARGEMLRRVAQFLRRPESKEDDPFSSSYLFFVLPLPCVENARYMDEARLGDIMGSLGFTRAEVKKTAKLYYSLWRYGGEREGETMSFAKKELRAGGKRNNFAIVLK